MNVSCAAGSFSPRVRALLAELKECRRLRDLERGRRAHSDAMENGDNEETYVASSLVAMYAKCGSLVEARTALNAAAGRNAICWNALLFGCVENGEAGVALGDLFPRMNLDDCPPNSLTFVAAVNACAATDDSAKGMAIHALAFASCGVDLELTLSNALVDMYAKCRRMDHAVRVFDHMRDRDLVSWNSLMFGYAENGEGQTTLKLYALIKSKGRFAPDAVSFMAALKACGDAGIEMVMAIHCEAAVCGSLWTGAQVASTLIDMYGKCGSVATAERVFHVTKSQGIGTWNSLVFGYVGNGEGTLALELFARMIAEGFSPDARSLVGALLAIKGEVKCGGIPSKSTWKTKCMALHRVAASCGCQRELHVASSLVDVYAMCGRVAEARRVYDSMDRHDTVSFNAILLGYAENGEAQEALSMFQRMEAQGISPDALTFAAALKACGAVVDVELGRGIHTQVRTRGLIKTQPVLGCALVDFYGKCGLMSDAQQVFDSLEPKTADITTWTALIAGYSRCGDAEKVIDLLDRMRDASVEPDSVTFLCVLTACSHAGLVEQGKEIFESMREKYGIVPGVEHYGCIVDLLCRAGGQLDAAATVVQDMPCKPNAFVWTTLLQACRKHGNAKIGKLAFDSLLTLDEKDGSAYTLLSNWEFSPKA